MVIPSLTRVLEGEYAAWLFLELMNSKVVVDAHDFFGDLMNRINIDRIYGGEYLFMATKIRQYLSNMKKCDLEPIFLAHGLRHKCRDIPQNRLFRMWGKLMTVLNYNNTTPHHDDIDKDDDGHEVDDLPFPPLWKSVFLDMLVEFDWKWAGFKYSCVPACIYLASQMKYPLVSSKSEYFLLLHNKKFYGTTTTNSESLQLPTHVPVKHLSLNALIYPDSDRLDKDSSTKWFLPAYNFDPKLSKLNQISNFHLPFLMCLFGTDTIPRTRLPDFPKSFISLNSSVHPKQRRWNALIKWLSLCSPDSTDPIDQFLDCYSPKDQKVQIQKLVEYLSSINYFSLTELQDVADLLSLNCPVNWLNDCLDDSLSKDLNKTADPVIDRATLLDLCRGLDLKLFEPVDFTSGWPPRFVQAFRLGKISLCILTTLYCPGGNVMPQPVEDTSLPNSVHDAAFMLRLLQYRILTGIEFKHGMQHKLVGLSPHAVEYLRHEDKLVKYEIPVRPLFVDFETKTVDNWMQEFLSVESVLDSNPQWLFSLAVTLSIWFRSLKFTDSKTKMTNLNESAIGLAVGVCALANYYNLIESSEQEICDFYLSMPLTLDEESDPQKTKPCSSGLLNRNVVHHFTAVQLVYHSLNNLVNILNYLSPANHMSKKFMFAPPWVVFPSGELVHCVANDLLTHQPSMRYNIVRKKWIPKLCYMKVQNMQAINKLQNITCAFDGLMSTSIRLQPNVPPSIRNCFTIHPLDDSMFILSKRLPNSNCFVGQQSLPNQSNRKPSLDSQTSGISLSYPKVTTIRNGPNSRSMSLNPFQNFWMPQHSPNAKQLPGNVGLLQHDVNDNHRLAPPLFPYPITTSYSNRGRGGRGRCMRKC